MKERRVYASITILLDAFGLRSLHSSQQRVSPVYRKKILAFYNNTTKKIASVWIRKYVAPVSLNDRLVYVYILRLVYINTHLTTGWYIPYSWLFTWGATFMDVFNLP